jgi:DNA-3-methyladenine glycosylase
VDREFFARDAVEVAPQLLGARLVGRGVTLRITEVEAYLGHLDPGSHAFRGQTRRNSTMFGPPGHLYTYFTYGMHVCANVVCSPEGSASGILLRAAEVVDGVELARVRRTTSKSDADLARGPALLTIAAGIELADDGVDLVTGAIRLELPASTVDFATEASTESALGFASGPRTGVSGAGGGLEFPWRFWLPGDASVSTYRAHVPKRRATATRSAPAE